MTRTFRRVAVAPKAHGCGGLNRLVDKRFGLPAPAGTNAMTLTTTVGLRSYPLI
jgi:hypothetical protein